MYGNTFEFSWITGLKLQIQIYLKKKYSEVKIMYQTVLNKTSEENISNTWPTEKFNYTNSLSTFLSYSDSDQSSKR